MLTFLTLEATVFYYDDDLELGMLFLLVSKKKKIATSMRGPDRRRQETPTYLPTYLCGDDGFEMVSRDAGGAWQGRVET
jgi:hypothetical protein